MSNSVSAYILDEHEWARTTHIKQSRMANVFSFDGEIRCFLNEIPFKLIQWLNKIEMEMKENHKPTNHSKSIEMNKRFYSGFFDFHENYVSGNVLAPTIMRWVNDETINYFTIFRILNAAFTS